MADFHRDFWLFAGTAGSVLLVASVVAASQTAGAITEAMLSGQSDIVNLRWRWKFVPWVSWHLAAWVASGLSMLCDLVLTLISAQRLSDETDSWWVGLAKVVLTLAVVSLTWQTVALIFGQSSLAEKRALDMTLPGAGSVTQPHESLARKRPSPRPPSSLEAPPSPR